jgi:hypothetical protein
VCHGSASAHAGDEAFTPLPAGCVAIHASALSMVDVTQAGLFSIVKFSLAEIN